MKGPKSSNFSAVVLTIWSCAVIEEPGPTGVNVRLTSTWWQETQLLSVAPSGWEVFTRSLNTRDFHLNDLANVISESITCYFSSHSFSCTRKYYLRAPPQASEVRLSAELWIIVECNTRQEMQWSSPDDKTRVRGELVGQTGRQGERPMWAKGQRSFEL